MPIQSSVHKDCEHYLYIIITHLFIIVIPVTGLGGSLSAAFISLLSFGSSQSDKSSFITPSTTAWEIAAHRVGGHPLFKNNLNLIYNYCIHCYNYASYKQTRDCSDAIKGMRIQYTCNRDQGHSPITCIHFFLKKCNILLSDNYILN